MRPAIYRKNIRNQLRSAFNGVRVPGRGFLTGGRRPAIYDPLAALRVTRRVFAGGGVVRGRRR